MKAKPSRLLLSIMLLILWAMVAPVHPGNVYAQTATHCGPLANGDETWSASDNVHVVTCDVIVPAGVTLTIEAGTIVKLQRDTDIFVYGKLVAQGTPSAPIYFTSYFDDSIGGDTDGQPTTGAVGDWGGVWFKSRDEASAITGTIIRYSAEGEPGRHSDGAFTLEGLFELLKDNASGAIFAAVVTFLYLSASAWLFNRRSRSVRRKWDEFAHTHGLKHIPQRYDSEFEGVIFRGFWPHLEGTYRNHLISLRHDLAKGRVRWGYHRWEIQIEIQLKNPDDRFLALVYQRPFSEQARSLDAPETDTGHKRLGERFRVKSAPEEFAVNLFADHHARLGDALANLDVKSCSIEVLGPWLHYIEEPKRHGYNQPEHALLRLDLMCDLAEAVEQYA